jgi:hypothetical protein
MAASARVLVMPSRDPEPYGLVAMEAAAARSGDPAALPSGNRTRDQSRHADRAAPRALAACAERERCAVVGELLGAAPDAGPGFVYLRDRRTGAEGAWWDCAALPRANPSRCLPNGSALTRLLADWG